MSDTEPGMNVYHKALLTWSFGRPLMVQSMNESNVTNEYDRCVKICISDSELPLLAYFMRMITFISTPTSL